MVDVADSKSADGNIVWVRVPPPAPRIAALHWECCYSYCLKGLEPEGAWKRAGGTFQPEAAFAAAKVESHHRHHNIPTL